MKTKILKSAIFSLMILLCVALALGVTGAYYRGKFSINAKMNFGGGIYLTLNGVTEKDQTSFYFHTASGDIIQNLPADDKNPVQLAAPTINVGSDTSVDFYIRAYIKTEFLKNGEPVELTTDQLFSQFLEFDSQNWKKYTDNGIDYYYLVSDTSAQVKVNNLRPVNKETGTINVFTEDSLLLQFVEDFNSLNGGPKGITDFKFSLTIEVVEKGHTSDVGWQFDAAG